MKSKIAFAVMLAVAITLSAQTSNPPTFIKGSLDIKYNTKLSSPPIAGTKDVYTLNINVCNSALFHGTISDRPLIMGGIIGTSVVQARSLTYDIACDVVNPQNPAQTKNVGRIYGVVPIDQSGVYHYDTGSLEISVLPMGNAGGFDSKFGGLAIGKPPLRPANWLDTIQRIPVSISRSVNGKTMTVVLKKYDKMEFRQHVLGAGPVQIYQPVTINGEMLYDYEKYSWFFNNVTVQYAVNGAVKIDRLTGNIRWVEAPNRKTSGEGEYQFDIRVNEPPPSESAAFAPTTDESAFFQTDSSISALTGTMKYKDTLRDDTTLASAVTVDIAGNNITKQQAMVLCKMLIFSAVVPMNSD